MLSHRSSFVLAFFFGKLRADSLLWVDARTFADAVIPAEKAALSAAEKAGRSPVVGAAVILPAVAAIKATHRVAFADTSH